MQQKTRGFPIKVKAVDQAEGIVTFIVSVFDVEDSGGDVVMPGFFAKAIAEQPRLPKYAPDHDWGVTVRLGKVLEWKEVDEGLEVTAQHNLEKQVSKDVFSDLLFDPDGQEFSFSYDLEPDGFERREGKRFLLPNGAKEVLDVGPVGIAMNRETRLVGAKAWVDLAGSVEEMQDAIRESVRAWAVTEFAGRVDWVDLVATYADNAVVCVYFAGEQDPTYFKFPFSGEPDALELGDPVEVEVEATIVEKAKARAAKEGRRNATKDAERIQSAHDLMLELGAECATKADESEADDEGKAEDRSGGKAEDPIGVDPEVALAELSRLAFEAERSLSA
jgi:HK97 family phage prohead protease